MLEFDYNAALGDSDYGPVLQSRAGSRIYTRDGLATLAPTADGSTRYSRAFARKIFNYLPHIEIVEYVTTGNKTDSQYVGRRGVRTPPRNVYVRICSTGGRWGKSAADYCAPVEEPR